MELKVWVEGIQRIVCGVTVNTTCQDVVFALAHATGKVGRFTLIERWRNNERLLAPQENPLKLLLKWGEYANDVQFILQRSENKQPLAQQLQHQQQQQQTQRQQQSSDEVTGSHLSNNLNGNAFNNRNTQANPVTSSKPLSIGSANDSDNINNNNNNSININNNNNNNSSRISSSNNSSNDSTFNVQQQSKQQMQQQSHIDFNFNTHHYDKSKELRKSFGAHDVKYNENVGIVKGIPQRITITNNRQVKSQLIDSAAQQTPQPMQISPTPTPTPMQKTQPHLIPRHEKSHSNPIEMSQTQKYNNNVLLDNFAFDNTNNNNNNNSNIYQQLGAQNSKSINEINLAEVRNALDRGITGTNQADSMEIQFSSSNNNSNNTNNNNNNTNNNEQLIDIYNGNIKYNATTQSDQYKTATAISANGALVPPPYRNPPPPRNSPLQHQQQNQQQQQQQQQMQQNIRNTNPFLNDYQNPNGNDNNSDYQNYVNNSNTGGVNSGMSEESESIFQASQYSDLLHLIRYQREKLSAQQMELSKYDAEIGFLETKERDQVQELEAIAREITKSDQVFRQGNEQLQSLQYVEEENELVKQQEKTLKSEIALLRSKLANCETELLQCKNKMRLLMNDIEMEQRDISNKQKNNRQNVEREFLIEMERIQSEIDQAMHNTDTSNKTADNLKKEIMMIENAIADKKRQLEQLINEMKEVNLQSLTVTTSEEIRHLLEGSNKPGSSRRIIGSPRQLENAVPTSKNPHGVWV